jgi:4-amino-4-deoxy-L-arabinose transferase-like glycosyltransferase
MSPIRSSDEPRNGSIRARSRILLIFIAIGLTARIAITVYLGIATPPIPGSDASEHDSYAWNLAQGHGYRGVSPDVKSPTGELLDHPSAYRAPGASIFWAGIYWIFGHRYGPVRLAQCVLDTLTILLLYRIARICFGETVALLAASVYAVWPTALLYSSLLGSEPLYAFLFCWSLLLSLQFAERPTWRRAAGAGALLGLALLTRGNAVMMVVLLIPWGIVQFRRTPRLIIRACAVPLIAVLMLVPWTIRNYRVLHAFVPLETGGGDVLLGSYNRVVANDPLYYGYWVFPTSYLPEYAQQITAPNDEVIRDHIEIRLAAQWTLDHPEKWWYLLESRFRRSWTPFLQPTSPRLYRLGTLVTWGPVLALLILGFLPTAIYFLRTNHPGWILHVGIFHFVLSALVFWGASRFRYPVEGLCIILASATLVWLCKRVGSKTVITPGSLDSTGEPQRLMSGQ